ncbi:acyl carrier protein [Thiotrichales bacterium 19S3-7]|nr:acyl carrier protein [Thiotrichales bacterium 19S3-7]MCF6802193.1 acyl carrier protein [Thiotrichales bacterium 19S3-11]
MNYSEQMILEELKKMFEKLFEIEPDAVKLESRLYEDLDLDSIDAVDLIVQLQELTKRKFNPEEFKSVKTVSDVVDVIRSVLSDESHKIDET